MPGLILNANVYKVITKFLKPFFRSIAELILAINLGNFQNFFTRPKALKYESKHSAWSLYSNQSA